MRIELPHNWTPRPYQMPAWRAAERGINRHLLVWHRRAGKDDFCLNLAAVRMLERPGTYWHMLPQYAQARKSVWDAVNPVTGKRRIDQAFPVELRESTRNQDMFIKLKNGSTWQLVGSDNFNALVGSPPVGITASEWALANPAAWGYLRPILRENGGWAAFISTPRGRNHLYQWLNEYRDDPSWFCEVLPATQTGVFSPEDLARERDEYRREYGGEDGENLFQQEYMCSFDAAIIGAYYAAEVRAAQAEGRVCGVPYEPGSPVYTVWDLGFSDDTAIIFFQIVGREIRIINYLASHGQRLDWYAAQLRNTGYFIEECLLPHDAAPKSLQTGVSAKQTLESLGLRCRILPRLDITDGIHAARRAFPLCWFDKTRCAPLLDALAQYRREWDADRKMFKDKPFHDFSSHAADSFRYLATSLTIIGNYEAAMKQQRRSFYDTPYPGDFAGYMGFGGHGRGNANDTTGY